MCDQLHYSRAYSPSGVSSFFEIHDRKAGKPIHDLRYAGARGGGFTLARGVSSTVHVKSAKRGSLSVKINGRPAPEAKTTRRMVKFLIGSETSRLDIRVHHQVRVPIGAGFGASASGTLSAALALADALGLDRTINQVALAAHRAEIVSRTGLGTVPALLRGGFILIRKAGGPGIAVIDQIPLRSSYQLVACHFGPILTAQVLGKPNFRSVVNRAGREAFRQILSNPTPKRFMLECRAFADRIGLLSSRARRAIEVAIEAGALGATQNMLGDAIHALADKQEAIVVERRLRGAFPNAQVFRSEIERGGARLI